MSTSKTKGSSDRYRSASVLDHLADRACADPEDLLRALRVNLKPSGKRFAGACPIHGGNNCLGFSWYADGEFRRGNWRCRSHGCHEHFPPTLVGLVRGVLSHQRMGWGQGGDDQVSHREAVDWLCEFLGIALADVPHDPDADKRGKVLRTVRALAPPVPAHGRLCSAAAWAKRLTIPSPYFLARGYRAETLREFGVGLDEKEGSAYRGRTLIPLHEDGPDPVNAIARSPWEKCGRCRSCHDPATPCPRPEMRGRYAKYLVVGQGSDKDVLYNAHRAEEAVRISRRALVVEGSSDVWRLREAGHREAVAILQAQMGPAQAGRLLSLVPRSVFVLTDADDAGEAAFRSVRDQVRFARVTRLLPPSGYGDVGSVPAEVLRDYLKGKL